MLRGSDAAPNQTIYINNLNEKVKKDELKKSLYAVFSQFGKILDIVALKTLKLRGQAWVVFDDITSATNALRQMQGFPFYDKPMRISYAKAKSDAVAKAEGNFVPREKKKNDKGRKTQQQAPAVAAVAPQYGTAFGAAVPIAPVFAAALVQPAVPEAPAPPNNTLFLQNLPHEISDQLLTTLFQQYPGFQEVRTISARPGIAFVEYGDEGQATLAMQGLQGFKIGPTNAIHITYANK